MPLVRIDVRKGAWTGRLRALADAVHEALVEVVGIPREDRFQVVTEHGEEGLIATDYLGQAHDEGVVLIQVTLSRGRPVELKKRLYQQLAARLGAAGVQPNNVVVSLVEVGREDWSFGGGLAQYAEP